jgi:hypothetical protein
VVADAERRVADRVVSVDDHQALGEVRLDAALERVACIEHEHGAAVSGARGAEVVDEAAEHGESAACRIVREQAAVQIVRADDRQRDVVGGGRPRDHDRDRRDEQCGERFFQDHEH